MVLTIAHRNSPTAKEMADREEFCLDCKYREKCKDGGIEFCSARDEGEPPVGSKVIDSVTGEDVSDDKMPEAKTNERVIYLESDITKSSVMPIVKKILEFNKEDSCIDVEDRVPIVLYINCDGGDETAGNALIDAMKQSITPITVIGIGAVCSMAFMVYLAASYRVAFENTEFLIHDGITDSAQNSTSKIFDQIDFLKRKNDRYRTYVLKNTSISEEQYDFRFRDDWYFFADEAKELGIVDHIVGLDVSLEELVSYG